MSLLTWSRAASAAAIGLALAGGSLFRPGSLPRLGPFLDPVHGVWGVAVSAVPPDSAAVSLPGLSAPASVRVDDRGVPHIFAATEEDAYRVMGYVVARDRLFQLELQARAGAGTLTELLGPRALGADRQARRLGLAWGAERGFAALDRGSLGYRAIVAYAEGVNAYLDALTPAGRPLEYRLLDRRPARWQPVNSAYLFARMGLTLAWGDAAEARLALQGVVGRAAAEALAPRDDPIQQPVQPHGAGGPRYAFAPLPGPGSPDSAAAALARDLARLAPPDLLPGAAEGVEGDALGSNNWAVSPRRTRDGHALLAGDPHLELTLPSIWYEAHVVVAGRLDVAGVSLPGSPGVVIGFNRDVAWSFTNTGGDVTDFYLETVDDSLAPTRYLVDGEWLPLGMRLERYRGPNGTLLATDTVRYTHRGPLLRQGGRWLSLRWTVHEASREADLFLRAARTRNAGEWLAVLADYVAPTQNGLVADREGTIAIRSAGAYPLRPGDGRGDVIRDGTSRSADWTGRLPVERYPFARNPAQGFLASANQQPVDPLDNPTYLGADWPPPWRALRINRLLRADSAVTPDAMRRYQTDPGSARADAFVPFFLAAAAARLAADPADTGLRRAAVLLRAWDRTYDPESRQAILFEAAMEEVNRRVWDELDGNGSGYRPGGSTLLRLMQDSTSSWWDDRATGERVEDRDEILSTSLAAALDSVQARYGPPAPSPRGEGWAWGDLRTANVFHLLRIPALSALGLRVRGGPSTIAPLSGRGGFGPSWRMVVELGPEVRAWATYPGGQSGNPASPRYADRIPQWVAGELDPVLLPRTPDELPASRVSSTLTLVPAR